MRSIAFENNSAGGEWHVVTPEYPPQAGGVSDYARLVAGGLADAGREVQVWCPSLREGEDEGGVVENFPRVRVRREFGRFSPKDLRRAGRLLDARPGPRRLFVQYVPHGYGWRAMNVAFCLWLWRRARLKGDRVELMVHEPFLHLGEGGLRHKAAALVQRVMAVIVLNAASRVWVSTPAWGEALGPFAPGRRIKFAWLPVPSTIEVASDADETARVRSRYARGAASLLVGHLGTYPRHTTESLKDFAPRLLTQSEGATLMLMGRGSEQARERVVGADTSLAPRVCATGALNRRELSAHLAACDLVVLPFPDGVTTRRTSAMAALAHARALLTTRGRLTESLWGECGAVALVEAGDAEALASRAARLAADPQARERLSARARTLYRERFDASHVVASLLSDEANDEAARENDDAREALAGKSKGVAGAKV